MVQLLCPHSYPSLPPRCFQLPASPLQHKLPSSASFTCHRPCSHGLLHLPSSGHHAALYLLARYQHMHCESLAQWLHWPSAVSPEVIPNCILSLTITLGSNLPRTFATPERSFSAPCPAPLRIQIQFYTCWVASRLPLTSESFLFSKAPGLIEQIHIHQKCTHTNACGYM